tara:strand:+ start:794 stop:1282 length:489 start_codon:yes stop_codon:yes gene_type:complete
MDLRKKVGIVMGSDSDWPVMQNAIECLKRFNISYSVTLVSAHRTSDRLFDYGKNARSAGFSVLIAGAGGSAHLPGMLAALTELPVIGVPISATGLNGIDSLLSIVQMPRGVPVATVAIDGAFNAGMLSVQLLGMTDPDLMKQIEQFRKEMTKTVLQKSLALE